MGRFTYLWAHLTVPESESNGAGRLESVDGQPVRGHAPDSRDVTLPTVRTMFRPMPEGGAEGSLRLLLLRRPHHRPALDGSGPA